MTRWLKPLSLTQQFALIVTAALAIAQAINLAVLLSERERAFKLEVTAPAIARFVDAADAIASGAIGSGEMQLRLPQRGLRAGMPRRPLRLEAASAVPEARRRGDAKLQARLATALRQAGVAVQDVRADTQPLRRTNERRGRLWPPGLNEVRLSAQLADGRWLNGRMVIPRPPEELFWGLAGGTLTLLACLLGATLWAAGRVAQPLRALTSAAAEVGAGARPQLPVSGPSDVRQALEAFNVMSRRVEALLQEKDVMLGALGHDLRTPLASLRIRIENMEPAEERARAAATIEEMTRLLEDILELARGARHAEATRRFDFTALVEDLVEDYRAMGAQVRFVGGGRATLSGRPALLGRLVGNLIDNAVNYAGAAEVRVESGEGGVRLTVEDRGPGMEPEDLARAAEPFFRGERSRSRETGGAGLGLTLVAAIAAAHGGRLALSNRAGGGLSAEVLLPDN